MLLTKTHIPQPKENVIPRNRLFEKLNDGFDRKLILVSAPAGYGKTTAVSQWIVKNKIPTAWVSIDHRDNDPYEFVSLVIRGIQNIHEKAGKQSSELLKSQGAVSIEYIIELLINDMLSIQSELLLVLDDLHAITSKEIITIINALIEHSPGNFTVAILTRSDPPLNLSRLRSQNELTELRLSDLSFTRSDISELFNRKLKIGLNDDDVQLIQAKTEGWIAGLQLTAISLQGKDNASEFINGIAGQNRFIMDYLVEEVLNLQSNEVKSFLLGSSILDKLSGTLCDAILDRADSQIILESLEKANMFIISLDNERKWYRYHHLFRDLLQQKLMITNKEEVPAFHTKACKWHEENGMPMMAVEHALKAGNIQRGFELVDQNIDFLVETSQYALILRYADLFSNKEVVSSLKHDILYAWTLTITGQLAKARGILDRLGEKLNTESFEPGTEGLLGIMYTTYTLLYDFLGDDESALKNSILALQHTPGDDMVWNAWAYYCKAGPHLLRLELDESISSLSKGLEFATKSDNAYLEIVHNKIAFLLRLKGRYTEALDVCHTMLRHAESSTSKKLQVNLFTSALHTTIGSMIVEKGNVKEGIEKALKGFELSQKLVSISFRGYCRYLLAETYYRAGKFEDALHVIENHDENLKRSTGHWLSVLSNALELKIRSRLQQEEAAESLYTEVISPANHHVLEYCLYGIASVHYFICSDRYDEALGLLEKLETKLAHHEAYELYAEVQILKVKAFVMTGREEEAMNHLAELLILTREEVFVRMYVNEAEQLESVLKAIWKEKLSHPSGPLKGIPKEYLVQLNGAIEIEKKRQSALSDGDLSSREIEILQLVSQKLSNKEICDTLYISLSTVKTHISNILLKLEADNRNDAVEKAKSDGIL